MTDNRSVPSGQASVWIDASPTDVWAHIADIASLARYSPETASTEWLDGATKPRVGARFRGHNADGTNTWHADCVIVEHDEPHRFAFGVAPDDNGNYASTCRYTLDPGDGGTTVTESFECPVLLVPESPPAQNPKRFEELIGMLNATLTYIKADVEATSQQDAAPARV